MREKPYYSVRTGRHPSGGKLDLEGAKQLFLSAFQQLYQNGFFQQVLGTDCVDAGHIPGSAGKDLDAFFFRKLKKPNLWPIKTYIEHYSEDDLFDIVELLYDCVSKGVEGYYHDWNECGWHYKTFDQLAGQNEYRNIINEVLRGYSNGYQLDSNGEIVVIPPLGLANLESAPPPPGDPNNVQARVEVAISKFRRRDASSEDRRDAIRDLADVLEFLRPRLKRVLNSKDEADLFNLINNFGIRHHNQDQKTQYDKPVWYSWMFYYYLATIHAVTRLIAKAQRTRTK